MRLFRALSSAEFGKLAHGSDTHGLWVRDRKVRFQVIGENRSRLLGEEQLKKLGEEEDDEEEPATEQRREYFWRYSVSEK